MDFIYKNLENKQDIKFIADDAKKIIAIYGKNGVGKTTFSTNEIWDKKYVFNEVFIRENIYISTDSGVSTSVDNKKNLSSLFIGNDIVVLQQAKELLDRNKKIFKEIEERLVQEIVKKFEIRIPNDYIRNIAESYVSQIASLDPYIKIDEIEAKVNEIKIDSSINSEIEFSDQVKIFNSQERLQSFLELISKNNVLSSIILKHEGLGEYNKLFLSIIELGKLLDSKKKVDEFLKERNVSSNPDTKLIKDFLLLQAENDNCIFCGSENKKADIDKWKELINNRYNQEREKVLSDFRSIKSYIEDVNKIKESVAEEIKKTITFLEHMESEINDTITKISQDNLEVRSSLDLIEFEKITKDSQDLKDNLIKYCIKINSKVLIASIFQNSNIDKKIGEIKKELDEKLNLQTSTIIADINAMLSQMQIQRSIRILVDKGGGNYKYKFTIDDKEIDTLSDGQRHNLALAFFLSSIKKSGLTDKTIVLDDPVVCLDEFGYHILHNNLISLRISEPTLRIVILTHNIYYLYVQLSNIFERDDLKLTTAFYRMSSTEVTEYDINVLRIDDFTLFKNCTKDIQTEDDLLIVSGIIPKIFRQFIDLRLRLKGIMFNDKQCDDIIAIGLDKTDEDALLDINRNINKICKDTGKYNIDNAVNLFKYLFEGLSRLKFDEFLTESDIDNLKHYSGNKNISGPLKSKNIYFDMIDAINDVFYRNSYPELRNYLAHPRQQITKQITSISNDL